MADGNSTTFEGIELAPEPNFDADLAAVFSADPFKEPAPAAPAAPAAQPAAPAAPAAAPEAPAPQDQIQQALLQQGATLEQIAARLNQPPAQPAAPQRDPREELMNAYRFNLVPEFMTALGSDDPVQRQQAVHLMMQVVATAAHVQMRQEFERRMGEMRQEMQTAWQNQATQATTLASKQDEMRKDFYGRYAHLDNPALRSIVRDTAIELAKLPHFRVNGGYTPALGDAIAERIHTLLPMLKPNGAAPAPQTRQVQPAAPLQFQAGTRPAPAPQPDAEQAAILETIGFT